MEEQQQTQQQTQQAPFSSQTHQPTRMQRFKAFVQECKRVIKITRKPSMLEFKTIVKVTALGMALIGFVGFVIIMTKQYLFP